MRPNRALLFLIGTLLTAGGYGATFLLSMRFRSIGGSDLDTGVALAGAMAGTFVGVPLVGWFSQHLGATRMAALAALCVGAGVVGFALVEQKGAVGLLPGFLVGFDWGVFHLAAPMSLVERTSDTDRGLWFFRFSTFQMAGIGASPALAAFAIRSLHWPISVTLYVIGGLCVIASLALETFGRLSPHPPVSPVRERWLREIGAIARTRAVFPIAMIALGACVFSGLMTFQMSLVRGTQAHPGTFFSLYTMTVVVVRGLLSRLVVSARPEVATKGLLMMMVLGIVAMFGVPYHASFQSAAAVLLGSGYGLVYPLIQAQAVSDSGAPHRRAALTWFVTSYFLGVFGFPSIGGWVLVNVGKAALLTLIAVCGLAALALAILQDRPVSMRAQ